ncbi:hypothetical protein GGI12_003209 [Dipsacomyces acuminosporus]|nr:hypothetical protein GGI12_003209 [Dipsacomyces acuminosporus]
MQQRPCISAEDIASSTESSTFHHKYALYVSGVGAASSNSISELHINNTGFRQAVEAAVLQQHASEPCTVWLDVTCPTASDITALTQIFDIEDSTGFQLLQGTRKQLTPGSKIADGSLYLCWAETTATVEGIGRYIVKGAFDEQPPTVASPESAGKDADSCRDEGQSTTLIGGYIPIPPWLQPSSTQVNAAAGVMLNRRKPKKDDSRSLAAMEDARQRYVQQLLSLLDRPKHAYRSNIQAVLKRWGPGHEKWQKISVDASVGKSLFTTSAIQRVSQERNDLVGYNIVQVWTRGAFVLTFHQCRSLAIDSVMGQLEALAKGAIGSKSAHPTEATSIVQGLIEHWVHATGRYLHTLERLADKLDHELTHPLPKTSIEASQWTPAIARSRKIALALLRRSQVNEAVLGRLCRRFRAFHLGGNESQLPSKAATAAAPHICSDSSPGHRAEMHDIVGRTDLQQHEALWLQCSRMAGTRMMYKQTEQRLSRLYTMILDRQKLRLLSLQQQIHKSFRLLVTVELVVLPIELWYNVDNLNGITTPGRLQPENEGHLDFYLEVLGMVVWGVTATFVYSIYSKFYAEGKRSRQMRDYAGKTVGGIKKLSKGRLSRF